MQMSDQELEYQIGQNKVVTNQNESLENFTEAAEGNTTPNQRLMQDYKNRKMKL